MKKLGVLLSGLMLMGGSANVLAGAAPANVACGEEICYEGYEVSLTCLADSDDLFAEFGGDLTIEYDGSFDVEVTYDNVDDQMPNGTTVCDVDVNTNELDKHEVKCTNALKGSNGKGNDDKGSGELEVEAEVKFTECVIEEPEV